MSPVVDEDRVAALVAAAREGRLPEEEAARTAQPRAQKVRVVDFRRPTKFHHEQQRRLRTAHETFCRTATARLGGELRLAIDLELLGMNQLTWLDAHAGLPGGALGAVLVAQPVGTPMLMSVELPLILTLVEVMAGAPVPDQVPAPRALTDCDTALARHFLELLAEHLSAAWQELADLRLAVADVDLAADVAELATASEPTLQFMFEVRLNGLSSTIGLLLPHRSIQPVEDRLGVRDRHAADAAPDAAGHMRSAVGNVELELRAQAGAVELPAAEVLSLKPGDLLELPDAVEGGIVLMAGETPVGRARPGRQGARRAVQLIEPAGGPRP